MEQVLKIILITLFAIYFIALVSVLTFYAFKVAYKLDKLKIQKNELEIKRLNQQINDHDLKKQFMQKEIELMEKRTNK